MAKAEELIETLRDTLGSLAVTLIETRRSPQMSMAAWLKLGAAPPRLGIDQDLELQSSRTRARATIRYARHPLEGKEIQAHLAGGMYATRLGLTWNDRIAFVLTEKLQIKRVEFLEELSKDSADGERGLDAIEQFDIDFAVMTGEVAKLLDDVVAALGDEVQERAAARYGPACGRVPELAPVERRKGRLAGLR